MGIKATGRNYRLSRKASEAEGKKEIVWLKSCPCWTSWVDLQPQGFSLQILVYWTCPFLCLAVLHSHWAPWDTGAQGTEKHSTEIVFILPQTPVIKDGQEREQAVKIFGGRNLPNQEHVSAFWLVLAQWRCQGCGYPLPKAALLHEAGTEGCTVCIHCIELYKTTAGCPCLSWPSHQAREGFISELCISESCQGAVETVTKQLHFPLCLGFGQKIGLTVTAISSSWLRYTLHICQKKWHSISVLHPSDSHSPLSHPSSNPR